MVRGRPAALPVLVVDSGVVTLHKDSTQRAVVFAANKSADTSLVAFEIEHHGGATRENAQLLPNHVKPLLSERIKRSETRPLLAVGNDCRELSGRQRRVENKNRTEIHGRVGDGNARDGADDDLIRR